MNDIEVQEWLTNRDHDDLEGLLLRAITAVAHVRLSGSVIEIQINDLAPEPFTVLRDDGIPVLVPKAKVRDFLRAFGRNSPRQKEPAPVETFVERRAKASHRLGVLPPQEPQPLDVFKFPPGLLPPLRGQLGYVSGDLPVPSFIGKVGAALEGEQMP